VPHAVEFPNHRPVYQNRSFTKKEVDKVVIKSSTAKKYTKAEGKPKVVNPLAVVNLPQGRLVLNVRYPNAFTKHVPFKYETLKEVLVFLRRNGFMATWDLKAGYFHVLIHPEARTYFGFEFEGDYYQYNGMCFGWSEACLVYTVLMQEVAMEVRVRGTPVSSYLDDGFTADERKEVCRRAMICIVQLLTLLGACFSLHKCQFEPDQSANWLGFEVDSSQETFQVAEKKFAKIKTALSDLLAAPFVTPRQLASVAEKLMATSPAVVPAALLNRPFFQAMRGVINWDQNFILHSCS
jgi:hypothetical protein